MFKALSAEREQSMNKEYWSDVAWFLALVGAIIMGIFVMAHYWVRMVCP